MTQIATPLPTYLQLEPVGQCNLRCQMCPIQFRQDGPPHGPPAFMAFDDFTHIIDEMPMLERLHLQGLGEPLMHPRFFDMVSYASARGIAVSTNTNLTLMTRERADRCIESGLSQLQASIDGARRETYNRIRVRSRFDRVLENLAMLVAARERAGSPTPGIRIVMVIMRQNLDELADIVRLAHRNRVESVHAQHLCHDFGESTLPEHYRAMRDFVSEQTLLGEDLAHIEHAFDQAQRVASELGVELRLPRSRPRMHAAGTSGRARCDWPWIGAYISYDGQAMPCCMVGTPDRTSFGSVSTEGLQPVWNGARAEGFRAALASTAAPEICQSCAVFHGVF